MKKIYTTGYQHIYNRLMRLEKFTAVSNGKIRSNIKEICKNAMPAIGIRCFICEDTCSD